uniref:putative receptor protein kinase ZmPK1 n=1 Tax=Erigeron canadensis TaxID=72917 RepID=UPI001CB8CB82|nr:putative receptor protein kinase ZmPK1 [Erigeron canadensis]
MNLMLHLLVLFTLIFHLTLLVSSSSPPNALKLDSSLYVDQKNNFLISPDGVFTAGFYNVGDNAFCFSIWFTKPLSNGEQTVVWMANRDIPVNGKRSKLLLSKTGNLALHDADQDLPIWTTRTRDTTGFAELKLNNSGNLYLQSKDEQVLWQSFVSPTDTLLPNQPLTKDATLVSSRSRTNYTSGFYKLIFDNDNVLRLVYSNPKVTGIYWPNPELRAWDAGRSTWGGERTAFIDSLGRFNSSDHLFFNASDDGALSMRRLTMDLDGNVRVYSLDKDKSIWKVTWQAISQTCLIHGSCGENSTCSNDPNYGKKCTCLPYHKMVNVTDWSYGCEPDFESSLCGNGEDEDDFLKLTHFDFYGYDSKYLPNVTLDVCKQECKNMCDCKGFQYRFNKNQGIFLCYTKFVLLNGFGSASFNGTLYLRVPKSTLSSNTNKVIRKHELNCSGSPRMVQLERIYDKKNEKGSIKFLLLFTYVLGALEVICIIYFFYKTRIAIPKSQGYLQAATGFERFSFSDLKKASENFKTEIGRGGGAVVYKGILSDNRVAAIKRLKEANSNHGEAEFLAEVSTLGKLNHMNLIDIWGYSAEGKHRILVYEYMENGSLADNLQLNNLDWKKRFDVAVGTAKGLAYLHEECLEWVLHCDVKPHNILLDRDYLPKVADFGLSKFLDRDGIGNSEFTKARGTRGYMAPEWFFVGLPITSKVDVYSYGVVMLEMITGRSPQGGVAYEKTMVQWVREKVAAAAGDGYGGKNIWIEEVVDSNVKGDYDRIQMAIFIKVALQCAEENKDARPTMSQVVDMLLHGGDGKF